MKIILFANTDWYLYNFRLELAEALQQAGYEVVLLSPDGDYRGKLEAAGFHWINLPISRRGVNPFSEVLELKHIIDIYRREKPDIVNHFTIKCVLYGSTAARLAGVKHIANSIEGLGFVFMAQSWKVRILRQFVLFWYRLILHGTRVIFLNQDDQKFFFKERLSDENNSVLVPGAGVNVQKFAPSSTPDGHVPLIVLAGRMLFDKGVLEYVEAARLLKREGVRARFALVGNIDSGNPAAIAESLIKSWQDEGIIEWWGWREHMEEVYHQASVVCLPSYREGLPKMLIEAGACGLPLVATDIAGCREVVLNGENGFLVPPKDSLALAQALKILIESPGMCQSMGERSREMVIQRFSTTIVLNQILAVYREMLKAG